MQQLIELKTRGFCLQKISCDDLPYRQEWETEGAPPFDLLSQSYTFLGAGSECFAFLSEDQTTVIKFFKLDLARPVYLHRGIFKEDYSAYAGTISTRSLPSLFQNSVKRWFGMREFRIQRSFNSIHLAYQTLREETGLVYLHLNPTTHLQKKLQIYDACGIAHTIDLDTTRFFLQKKALPLEKQLGIFQDENDHCKARASIDSLLEMITARCQKGFADRDVLDRNLGLIDTKAIEIDSGSFLPCPQMKDPLQTKQELFFATRELHWWLEHHYPEMAKYLEERIAQEIAPCANS